MNSLTVCKSYYHSPFFSSTFLQSFPTLKSQPTSKRAFGRSRSRSGVIRRCSNEKKSFLTFEEAGLVEISGLSTHEKFLCRLTISSLNLLRVISEEEGCSIGELNAGRLCDWFVKDKLKREQDTDSAVLQWGDSDFPQF